MANREQKSSTSPNGFDVRDRLILALYAQLKAERQTREAIEWAARHGGLSNEVLAAMAADPVPVITDGDVAAVERLLTSDGADMDLGVKTDFAQEGKKS